MTLQHKADEDILMEKVNTSLETWSDHIAGMLGPAPGTEHVTGKDEIALWNEEDTGVDVMAEYFKARQEKGLDPEAAMDAASLLKYKNRGVMLLHAAPDDEGRKAYAQKMKRLSEKQRSGDDT